MNIFMIKTFTKKKKTLTANYLHFNINVSSFLNA